ncbi:hypothetical protein DN062_02180 [Nitrincola tibetensis]|uniref:DUF4158 domain-containing protein n=1 Tax=Nitrincola tibetensis TaxID=2219697 RepID=A0A364NS95_9GAMM|nr:DUF4158 domain-containing protein [Nitrincola tibetensis]RAU19902.1 hypothetical protein DN062_02180 [Nitrincola tibetensis]
MAEKRIQILSDAEVKDLFSAQSFNEHDRRYFFSLNYAELRVLRSLRHRLNKRMFVVMLGYF